MSMMEFVKQQQICVRWLWFDLYILFLLEGNKFETKRYELK